MVRGARPKPHWLESLLHDTLGLIEWLQSIELLADSKTCWRCNSDMKLMYRKRSIDSYTWYCKRCLRETSVRDGSIFAQFRALTLATVVKYFWIWSDNIPETKAFKEVKSYKCRAKLRKFCNSVAMQILRRHPLAFNNPAGSYCVDESLFATRKYNRGRRVTQRWVFGMVDFDEPTKAIFYYVASRNRDTLSRLITHCIPRGSTVVSDGFQSYTNLNQLGYLHLTVNHSLNFVDPITGAHTNVIEGAWRICKRYIEPKQPKTPIDLQVYLNVYMWRQWYAKGWPGGVLARLLTDIRRVHPLQ